jgi:hypothetical protein
LLHTGEHYEKYHHEQTTAGRFPGLRATGRFSRHWHVPARRGTTQYRRGGKGMCRISGPSTQISKSPMIRAVRGADQIVYSRGKEVCVPGNRVTVVHPRRETSPVTREGP